MNLPFLARRVLHLNAQAQALHLPTLTVGTPEYQAYQEAEREYEEALQAFLSDPLALAQAVADEAPARALDNIRLLTQRDLKGHPSQETLLRFCQEGGSKTRILRGRTEPTLQTDIAHPCNHSRRTP